ncbi:MAG: hypothetical protein JRI54_11050 [Deltaproteobacteria bacterium]|nr:hypothetical protein [Deltaproteobacteria bacterium]MBW2086544.1 hypothetical protein [Deltaproteobacteria bacterium]
MDTMPAGFPATDTGVEIKILKKMFTPEQAELTMKLKKEPEEVPAILYFVNLLNPPGQNRPERNILECFVQEGKFI